jgi:hypothetical protein
MSRRIFGPKREEMTDWCEKRITTSSSFVLFDMFLGLPMVEWAVYIVYMIRMTAFVV